MISYASKTDDFNNFVENTKKLPLKYKLLVFFIVSLGILGQYCYFRLLRRYDVTTLLPIIRGGSAILLILFGYYIFSEAVTFTKIVGIAVVIFGMYLISKA